MAIAQHFLLSALIYTFVLASKFGRAFEYPHLGAAGVVAEEYLPQAEPEGETDQYFPQAGLIGTNPALIFNKALECLGDEHIYSSCDAAYRLTQEGELNVPPEYTDEYCNGACVTETHHVLDCINSIFSHFVFYNRATLSDVRDTIEGGCSYGPLRGNFNVLGHVQADEGGASATKVVGPVFLALIPMVVTWQLML